MKKNMKPLLKWAGGKSKLVPIFEENYPIELKENKITTYIEPFIGGGAVLFNILSKYNFDKVIINDINSELILVYNVVRECPEKLMSYLDDMQKEYNHFEDLGKKQEYYYEIREKFNELKGNIEYGIIDEKNIMHSAYMIFLNKCCFNGLYRENKKGKFNVPFGKKDKINCYDRENILVISESLKKVTILNGDFSKVLDYVDEKTFIYMDPPYRPLLGKASFKEYSKEDFNDEEQIRLAKFYKQITEKGAKVMESNSDPKNIEDDDFFDELYSEYRIERISAARSINSKGTGRGKVSELLIMNY